MGKKSKTDLSSIQNISNLNQLVKFDKLIKEYTKGLVKGNPIYEDIVQDFYIKADKYIKGGKTINGGYTALMLRSIWIDHLRFEKRYTIEYVDVDTLCDEEEIKLEKNADEILYDKMYTMISELRWSDRKILELNLIMSLSEISRRSGIPYVSLIYTRNKINQKLGIIKKKK